MAAADNRERASEPSEEVWVYFELGAVDDDVAVDDDPVRAEQQAAREIWDLLSDYVESTKLRDEGHDAFSALICNVLVSRTRLRDLQQRIVALRGGGDDVVYLEGGYQASQFQIVEVPGISMPVPFDDWDDYLEAAVEKAPGRQKRRQRAKASSILVSPPGAPPPGEPQKQSRKRPAGDESAAR